MGESWQTDSTRAIMRRLSSCLPCGEVTWAFGGSASCVLLPLLMTCHREEAFRTSCQQGKRTHAHADTNKHTHTRTHAQGLTLQRHTALPRLKEPELEPLLFALRTTCPSILPTPSCFTSPQTSPEHVHIYKKMHNSAKK